MNVKTIDFKVGDDKYIKLYHWDEVESPKGVVQIVHDMIEHAARYTKLAKFLNKNGYHVYANDLRGHGFNVTQKDLSYDEGNMWESDLTDQLRLTEYIKIQHPGLPVIVLGQGYGSMLLQAYMPINKSADAFVLSGSDFAKGKFFLRMVANQQFRRHGDYRRAQLMYDLTVRSYQSDFKGNGSWLTTDGSEVEKYKKDIRCGYVPSTNFFKWYYWGMSKLYKEDPEKLDRELPVMLLSGGDDAVCKYGKGITKLYDYYLNLGMKNVTFKLYDGGRHEMLNESNKEEVFDDVLAFVKNVKMRKSDLE